ncbi:MAG: hypothetical protein QM610_06145 [Chitinophagaceae bacterium]
MINRITFFLLLSVTVLSCSAQCQSYEKKELSMVIDGRFSNYDHLPDLDTLSKPFWRYDISQRIFTKYVVSPIYTTHISMTNLEVDSIIEKYYSLKLNEFDSVASFQLDERLRHAPEFATYIIVKNKNRTQLIEYQEGSEKNQWDRRNIEKARRVKEFLDFTFKIINCKPEIINAPRQKIGFQ